MASGNGEAVRGLVAGDEPVSVDAEKFGELAEFDGGRGAAV